MKHPGAALERRAKGAGVVEIYRHTFDRQPIEDRQESRRSERGPDRVALGQQCADDVGPDVTGGS